MKKTIVVTGATGKVGGAVVKALSAEGIEVRAATRKPENYHAGRHVTPVRVDYQEPSSIYPALTGADGLFLIALPLDPKAPEVLAPVIEGAKAAGIKQVVFHSALAVDEHEEAPLRMVERNLMASGLSWTIVRSNFFMENFVEGAVASTINTSDGIYLPAGEGKTSFIATHDIAAVALAAFQRGLAGKEFNLTGPEAWDHYRVAEIISEAAGRRIVYHALPEGDFLNLLRTHGMPDESAQYLAMLYAMVREGRMAKVTRDLFDVTGRYPLDFAEFAEDHAGAWQNKEEVAVPYASKTLVGQPLVHHHHAR